MDYHFVTNRLATGAALQCPADVDVIVASGITHVVNCREDFDDAEFFVIHPSITYLWNPTADDGEPKPASWFLKSITFAMAALALAHTKVYVHCAAGINRGPSTCYAILRAQGLPPTLAEQLIRQARPIVELRYKADADAAINPLYD